MLLVTRLQPGLRWKLCRGVSCSRDASGEKKPNNNNYLGDPESAIRGKTSWEVFRGWLVFKLFSYDLVDNSTKVSERRRKIIRHNFNGSNVQFSS